MGEYAHLCSHRFAKLSGIFLLYLNHPRLGMHLLFHGPAAIRFVTWGWIRKVLKEQSIRRKHTRARLRALTKRSLPEGKIYDSTDPETVLPQIQSFIETYSISTSELLEPDLNKYPV
jgi:phosphatidylserine decarboxylase